MSRLILPTLALLLVTACSDGAVVTGGSPQPQPASSQVATVTVSPENALVVVGDTLRLRATTLDVGGTVLGGRLVAWASESQALATVTTAGLVTAVAPGLVRITATSEGRSGQASMTVVAR